MIQIYTVKLMLVPALNKIWVFGENEPKLLFPKGIDVNPNYRTSNSDGIFRLTDSYFVVMRTPIKNGLFTVLIRPSFVEVRAGLSFI